MKQGIVHIIWQRSTALGSRPDFWLACLLVWILGSASRSLGTPWAHAALTEALRWSAGIGVALTLGWYLRRTPLAGQFLVTLLGAFALLGILGSDTASHSSLVGPYHDHQLYGSVLLLLLPFSAATAFTACPPAWRWGAYAAFTAGTLCLLLSQTRSAWIGLVCAILVFTWLWLRRTFHHPQQAQIVLVPTGLLLTGLLSVWLLAGPVDQKAALTSRAASLTALTRDGSWQSRLELWRGTALMVARHPAAGIGLGRYPSEQWHWTHVGGPLNPAKRPSLTSEAHSFYLQTAAETGGIGLGFYLAALTAFAVQGLRRLRKSRRSLSEQSALLIASVSALAGQSIDALASPSWQFPEASFFFWGILGLGLATLRRDESQPVSAKLPYSLQRVGQFAFSGTVAVVLTAQVLPIGLLTPVEAYDHLASSAYQSVAITEADCTTGAMCFTLTAKYSDGTRDVTFDDGGLSKLQSTFTCVTSPNYTSSCLSQFGGTATRNQLTLTTSEKSKTLKVTGQFVDFAYPSLPPVSGKGAGLSHGVTMTILPSP